LSDRDFRAAEPERTRDAHAVNRTLIPQFAEPRGVVLRKRGRQQLRRFFASHEKFTRRNAHERNTSRVRHPIVRCAAQALAGAARKRHAEQNAMK